MEIRNTYPLWWASFFQRYRNRHRESGLGNRLGIKNKRAALGRRSGKHCGRHKFLGRFQGTPESGDFGGYFAFYSPIKSLRQRTAFVK
jgi:hypothetical protein